MDYLAIAQALLKIIALAPQLPAVISEAETIYAEVKSALSATDQAAIDAALASAKASDAAATAAADAALTDAEKQP